MKDSKFAWICVALIIIGLLSIPTACKKHNYQYHSLLELKLEPYQIQEFLLENSHIDIWSVKQDGRVQLRASPQQRKILLETFQDVKVVVEDLQTVIDEDFQRISKSPSWNSSRLLNEFFDEFRPYHEVEEYVNTLVAQNPNLLQKFLVGTTFENREIFGVRLSTGGVGKKAVVIGSLVHAREWLATTTTLWALTDFIDGYKAGDSRIVTILSDIDWYFVPVVNVDGYLYSWATDRLWRKNRRRNSNGSYGVDLNRNWGPNNTWCTSGSSTLPSSDTYCGTAPFSEPETTYYSKLVDTVQNLKAVIDMHTYGYLLLRPFQYSYNIPPDPYKTITEQLGSAMETSINAVNRANFESIRGVELYPHSGGAIDYTYFTHNIPAYTFELRGNSFIVPNSDIPLSGEEVFAGLLVLGDWINDN